MLTDVPSVKRYLGKKPDDNVDDDLLLELIKRWSIDIAQHCNRFIYNKTGAMVSTLEAVDIGEKVDGNIADIDYEYRKGDGTNRLLLRHYPINQVYSIYDDVDRAFPATSKKDTASIIISYEIRGLIQIKGDIFINADLWSFYNIENIRVAYNAGYKSVPENLKSAANTIISLEYMKSKGVMAALAGANDPQKMLDAAWATIDTYYLRMR